MAACSRARLLDEWTRSAGRLSDVLGEPIVVASVPGGHHSRAVAETAAEAGILTLFTSMPTLRVHSVNGATVVGRFAIYATTRPATAARLAEGAFVPRAVWIADWLAKRAAKAILSSSYLRLRARALGASPEVGWGDEVVSEDAP